MSKSRTEIVIGISPYHDSAVAVVSINSENEGIAPEPLRMLSEDRASGIPHHHGFPYKSLRDVIDEYGTQQIAGIAYAGDVDCYLHPPRHYFVSNEDASLSSSLRRDVTTFLGAFLNRWRDKLSVSSAFTENEMLLDLRLDFVSSFWGYTLSDASAKQIAYLGLGIIRTLQIESRIKRLMQGRSVTTRGFNHHRCHAELFKFCGAPIRRVVTWDGRGEFDTAVLWDVVQAATTRGGGLGTKSAELKRISSIQHPHSLGSFYAIFSSFLGFDLLSGPGKLMGLAPYGYFDAAIDSVVSNSIECGNNEFKFELSTSFFAPGDPEPLSLNAQALKILGRSRRSDEPITQQHKNIAWSVQRELERASLTLTRNAVSDLSDEQQHMFFAGGVALNCVLNAQLFNVLRGVHLLPCSGDDGIALGAASLMRTILES